jgi:hypothetical protein
MLSRVLLVGVGLTLGGCASLAGYPDNPISVDSDVLALNYYFNAARIAEYQGLQTEAARLKMRNDIAYGRMAAYDAEFSQFQQRVNAEGGFTDTAFDFTSLTLTAIGASPVATVTKTTVSAAATAVNGGRTSIDKNIFYDKTLPALFAQMEANRLTVRTSIVTSLTKLDTTTYPLGAALSDLETYRDAGSLPGAISGVTKSAGNQSFAMQARLMCLRGLC